MFTKRDLAIFFHTVALYAQRFAAYFVGHLTPEDILKLFGEKGTFYKEAKRTEKKWFAGRSESTLVSFLQNHALKGYAGNTLLRMSCSTGALVEILDHGLTEHAAVAIKRILNSNNPKAIIHVMQKIDSYVLEGWFQLCHLPVDHELLKLIVLDFNPPINLVALERLLNENVSLQLLIKIRDEIGEKDLVIKGKVDEAIEAKEESLFFAALEEFERNEAKQAASA